MSEKGSKRATETGREQAAAEEEEGRQERREHCWRRDTSAATLEFLGPPAIPRLGIKLEEKMGKMFAVRIRFQSNSSHFSVRQRLHLLGCLRGGGCLDVLGFSALRGLPTVLDGLRQRDTRMDTSLT